MKTEIALQRLHQLDRQGRYVYALRDLAKVFYEDSPATLQAGLRRLLALGILERPAFGVYLYCLSGQRKGPNTIELIARTLRRGEYSYVSLESALSEYGVISQIPLSYLTVMTTGRSGTYHTPYGTIEFVHTKRAVTEILQGIIDTGRPLRMASKAVAWRDLKRVGRNLHLVDREVLNED